MTKGGSMLFVMKIKEYKGLRYFEKKQAMGFRGRVSGHTLCKMGA